MIDCIIMILRTLWNNNNNNKDTEKRRKKRKEESEEISPRYFEENGKKMINCIMMILGALNNNKMNMNRRWRTDKDKNEKRRKDNESFIPLICSFSPLPPSLFLLLDCFWLVPFPFLLIRSSSSPCSPVHP